MEPNTSSTNEKFNALWLSPDEWLIYFDINDKNKTNKEVFKKTYVNKRFIRESIQHYDTKS